MNSATLEGIKFATLNYYYYLLLLIHMFFREEVLSAADDICTEYACIKNIFEYNFAKLCCNNCCQCNRLLCHLLYMYNLNINVFDD